MGSTAFLILCGCIYLLYKYRQFSEAEKARRAEEAELAELERQREAEAAKLTESMEVSRAAEIINESSDLVDFSSNPATRLGRLELIISRAQYILSKYPHRTEFRDPLEKALAYRVPLHNKIIEDSVQKCMDKARAARTITGKMNSAAKALEILREALDNEYADKVKVKKSARTVRFFMYQEELKNITTKAEKFEFKANYKKALDAYQDALFFLKQEDIGEPQQADDIQRIEKKIEEMRERINAPKVGEKK